MKSNVAQSVSRNVAILSVQKIITLGSSFLILLFLPRYLGPIDYGRFYLGLTIITMFATLVDFGGHYSITKAVSRAREDVGHIISDSTAARVILWAFSFILVISFSFIAGYHPTQIIIIIVLAIGMIWSNIRSMLSSCFQGFEMMKYPSYGIMVEAAFIALLGIPALLFGVGPIGYAIITALSWLVNFFICAKFTHHMTKFLPRINWKASVRLLKDGWPYFLNSVFGIIYFRIDSIMLSLMTPEPVIGWYGAAYRFFDSLMFVPNIFTIALFPALSRLWVQEQESVSRRFQRSLDFIFIVGVPIAIGAFFFSGEIIAFFFGIKGYSQSILLMRIFSAGLLLMYIDWILGTMLLASDKQRELSRIAFSMIFVNIGLNFLMIPITQAKFGNGGIGSAVATFITEFFVMILMMFTMDKSIFSNSKISIQVKTLGAGAIMACAIWIGALVNIGWIGQAIVGSAVYLVAAYYFGAIQRSDIQLVKETIPQRFFQRK